MKKILSISLIIILSIQSLYQLGLFTYFEVNREYIAKVLCINRDKYVPGEEEITMCGGKCFLKKKLKLLDEIPSSGEKIPGGRLKIEIPSFVLSEYTFAPDSNPTDPIIHYTPYREAYAFSHKVSIFHPPATS